MTPGKTVEQKEIPVVEINNATLTFKDGDKPVFTGTTPNDAPYALVFEEWRTDGEWTRSDEWFNDADHHVHLFLDDNLRHAEALSFHPNDCRGTVVVRREDFERYLACVGNTYEYIRLYEE